MNCVRYRHAKNVWQNEMEAKNVHDRSGKLESSGDLVIGVTVTDDNNSVNSVSFV